LSIFAGQLVSLRCVYGIGVGPKTVSCVLMFGLGRAEFPVDTHVWKIALALGWVRSNVGARFLVSGKGLAE